MSSSGGNVKMPPRAPGGDTEPASSGFACCGQCQGLSWHKLQPIKSLGQSSQGHRLVRRLCIVQVAHQLALSAGRWLWAVPGAQLVKAQASQEHGPFDRLCLVQQAELTSWLCLLGGGWPGSDPPASGRSVLQGPAGPAWQAGRAATGPGQAAARAQLMSWPCGQQAGRCEG